MTWWKVVKPGAYLAAIIALLLVGSYWGRWRQNQKPGGSDAAKAEISKETKPARKWKRKVVQRPVAEPVLSEADVSRLVKKFQRPDIRPVQAVPGSTEPPSAPTTVLTETEDKRAMPAGADVLVTLDQAGKVETTVVPRPIPFFGAPLKFRFYLEGGVRDLTMEDWQAEAGIEFRLFRVGVMEFQPKVAVGYYSLPGLATHETRLFTGLRITFEGR